MPRRRNYEPIITTEDDGETDCFCYFWRSKYATFLHLCMGSVFVMLILCMFIWKMVELNGAAHDHHGNDTIYYE